MRFFYARSLLPLTNIKRYPDRKVHGANMGPTWVLSAPDGPHVGPMNLAIRIQPRLIIIHIISHRGPEISHIWHPVCFNSVFMPISIKKSSTFHITIALWEIPPWQVVNGIRRRPVYCPHESPVTRNHYYDVTCWCGLYQYRPGWVMVWPGQKITFIFVRFRHSLATVTLGKYDCDSKDTAYNSASTPYSPLYIPIDTIMTTFSYIYIYIYIRIFLPCIWTIY